MPIPFTNARTPYAGATFTRSFGGIYPPWNAASQVTYPAPGDAAHALGVQLRDASGDPSAFAPVPIAPGQALRSRSASETPAPRRPWTPTPPSADTERTPGFDAPVSSVSPYPEWERGYRSLLGAALGGVDLFPVNTSGRDMEQQTRRMFTKDEQLVSMTDPEPGEYFVVDSLGTKVWIVVFEHNGHRFMHPMSGSREVASIVCPSSHLAFFAAGLVRAKYQPQDVAEILAVYNCVSALFPTQSGGLFPGPLPGAARKRSSAAPRTKQHDDGFKGASISGEGFDLLGGDPEGAGDACAGLDTAKPLAAKRKRAKKSAPAGSGTAPPADGDEDTDGEAGPPKKAPKKPRAKKQQASEAGKSAGASDLTLPLPDMDGARNTDDELAELPNLPDELGMLHGCGEEFDEMCAEDMDGDQTDAVDSDGERYTKSGKAKGKGRSKTSKPKPHASLFFNEEAEGSGADDDDHGQPSEILETPIKAVRKRLFDTPPHEPSAPLNPPSAPARPAKGKGKAVAVEDEVEDFPDDPIPPPSKAVASAAKLKASTPALIPLKLTSKLSASASDSDKKPAKLPVKPVAKAAGAAGAAPAAKAVAKPSESGKGQNMSEMLGSFSDGDASDNSPKKGKKAATDARTFAEAAWD